MALSSHACRLGVFSAFSRPAQSGGWQEWSKCDFLFKWDVFRVNAECFQWGWNRIHFIVTNNLSDIAVKIAVNFAENNVFLSQ
jgi:hypothetical protein